MSFPQVAVTLVNRLPGRKDRSHVAGSFSSLSSPDKSGGGQSSRGNPQLWRNSPRSESETFSRKGSTTGSCKIEQKRSALRTFISHYGYVSLRVLKRLY